MDPSELLALAKAGDPIAIATLLNRSLTPKGITAKVALQEGCLQVMLEADTVPDPTALKAFIYRGITHLGSPLITTVRLYGRQIGQKLPAWTETWQPGTPPAPPHPAPPPQESAPPTDSVSPVAAASPPLSLKERARQGDQEALTTLLNRAIAGKGVNLTVDWQGPRLQVELESHHVPDDGLVNVLIHRELSNLRSPLIKSVLICGRETDQPTPAWSQELVAKPIGDGSLYIQYVPPGQEEEDDQPASAHRSPGAKSKGSKSGRDFQAGGRDRPVDRPVGTFKAHPTATRPASGQRDLILERKILSCVCHGSVYFSLGIFTLLLPIGLFVFSPDPVVRGNAKEVLNLYITLFLGGIGIFFSIFLLARLVIVLIVLLALYGIIMPAVAVIQCLRNPEDEFRYPFIVRVL